MWRARLGDHAPPSTADARRMEAQWIFQMALSKQAAAAYEEAAGPEVEPQKDASLVGRWSKLNPLGHRARFLRGLLVCGASVTVDGLGVRRPSFVMGTAVMMRKGCSDGGHSGLVLLLTNRAFRQRVVACVSDDDACVERRIREDKKG